MATPDSNTKVCTKCGTEYPATLNNFSVGKRYKGGLRTWCKTCERTYHQTDVAKQRRREYYYQQSGGKPFEPKTKDGQRQCRTCKEWFLLDAEHFHRSRSKGNGGFAYYCVDCARKQKRDYSRTKGHKPNPVRRNGDLKQCSSCEKWLPATAEFFYRGGKRRKDKLYPECKECASENSRKLARARGVQPPRVIRKDGLKRCPDCDEWKPNTLEYFRKHVRRVDGLSGICKLCANTRNKDSYDRNPQRTREAAKCWIENNPERHKQGRRIIAHRRRARIRQLPATFTIDDWKRCLSYWNNQCAICGRTEGLWHIIAEEHWIPVADPRVDNPGYVPENILPMCHASKGSNGQGGCNQSKWVHDPEQWVIDKLGEKKGKQKLTEIHTYFEWTKRNHKGEA